MEIKANWRNCVLLFNLQCLFSTHPYLCISPVVTGSHLAFLGNGWRISYTHLILGEHMMFKSSEDLASLSSVVLPVREMVGHNISVHTQCCYWLWQHPPVLARTLACKADMEVHGHTCKLSRYASLPGLAGLCCRVKAQDLAWSGDCPYSWIMDISPCQGLAGSHKWGPHKFQSMTHGTAEIDMHEALGQGCLAW